MPTLLSLIQAQRKSQEEPEQAPETTPAPEAPVSEPTENPVTEPAVDNPADISADPSAENPIDANGDGMISPEELFGYFDSDGDGQMTMQDFAAHILFHLYNPAILKPYMSEAKKIMDLNKESYAKLANRLQETIMISKADPRATDKAKDALTKGDDVKVVDKDKINQLKIQESAILKKHMQRLAGI